MGQLPLFDRFNGRVLAIPAYRDKESFGDMDVLVELNGEPESLDETLTTFLKSTFGASTVRRQKNSDVVNFDLPVGEGKLFQIDLLLTQTRVFEHTLGYFAYNDLGNLIGVLARKMGLRFGHKGLLMTVSNQYHKVEVCLDFDASLLCMGLDPVRHAQGFQSLEYMFECVASTSYFSSEFYQWEARSHEIRVRDRKRTTHQLFLQWCKANQARFDEQPCWMPLDKEVCRGRALDAFPDARVRYQELLTKMANQAETKRRFNGEVIAGLTGL